jgi:hypothetical protein
MKIGLKDMGRQLWEIDTGIKTDLGRGGSVKAACIYKGCDLYEKGADILIYGNGSGQGARCMGFAIFGDCSRECEFTRLGPDEYYRAERK